MTMGSPTSLAQIEGSTAPLRPAAHLTRRQKAAIIVRFLLKEGAELRLADLPEPLQESLTTQMGAMRYVDRETLIAVLGEFASELEAMGLIFPHGVAGALSELGGRLSPQTASRLRKEAGVRQMGDPWDQVRKAELSELAPLIQAECTEVAAVLLSKLEVTRAAELLGKLPGETARRITYAVSQTEAVNPVAVERIGMALAAQLADKPVMAFADGPVERVGAILNSSLSSLRDDVLSGLEEEDRDFAEQVRKAIFTFAHIPERLGTADVPRVLREVDQTRLVTALAAAGPAGLDNVAEFLLSNMSKRMSENLREAMQEMGTVRPRTGEEAMTEVINAIRRLDAAGEISLVTPQDDDEED
ncbi:MAG: flagellar motor switch protein FliG [Roseovarius sp.]|uniref:Flagellar motor switch protein FliG n=2 Tax=Roseovarius nubinhibens TaxID=314263 RepID=A3SRF7_ROSNI|nr:flagellar motor switch protein FliG [Roseovarius nubinhibens ISM]MAZ21605.1 flagellar motor switch protein FliG [Roseovarius sp.]